MSPILQKGYEKMEAYSFGRKYSPTDVLSDMSNDNPDALMKFLFLLNNVMVYIRKKTMECLFRYAERKINFLIHHCSN